MTRSNTLDYIGVLQEEDLSTIPAPMAEAYEILRDIAHCGMPLATSAGTLKVYLRLHDAKPYCAVMTRDQAIIRRDGSIKFGISAYDI